MELCVQLFAYLVSTSMECAVRFAYPTLILTSSWTACYVVSQISQLVTVSCVPYLEVLHFQPWRWGMEAPTMVMLK